MAMQRRGCNQKKQKEFQYRVHTSVGVSIIRTPLTSSRKLQGTKQAFKLKLGLFRKI